MEQESQNREVLTGPMLCANNCGFFGSAATNNFCSKCYRDFYLKQSKASSAVPIVSEKKPIEPVAVLEATPSKEESSTSGGKRPTNRCTFCKKRVGLTGFKCRCDQTFCDIHRYSDKHDCMFDYKTAAQDAIAKANPVVKADKVEKI